MKAMAGAGYHWRGSIDAHLDASVPERGPPVSQPVPSYDEILRQIRRLTPVEQAHLLEILLALVERRAAKQPRRSILELQGLGKEIWQDVDAQEYVNRERAAWTG